MSFPDDLLSTRAIVRPGLWAVLPDGGLVNNVVPPIENCKVSIVASPKMGASFVQYMVDAGPEGGMSKPWAAESGIESFLYCIDGRIQVTVGEESRILEKGGYVFAPAQQGMQFKNINADHSRIMLYKQVYTPLEGYSPWVVWGNINQIEGFDLHGMQNVQMKNLLPCDLGFDFNFHTLTFRPGASHDFIETHVQEHGAFVLTGEGMYYIDDHWMGIKKGDFIWFGPYVTQAAYAVGTEEFSYIYSKDCNRDVIL